MAGRPLFTIGHSTRPIEELVALCRAHGIGRLVDVRRFPGSRRHPQFGREALEAALGAAGIAYAWREALGGRRPRAKGAPPSAWRVAGFAGYADYMLTPEFAAAAAELVAQAEATAAVTAFMCAEANPYGCHRRLIADWLELHGIPVEHVTSSTRRERHKPTPFARRAGDHVVYDPQLALFCSPLPRGSGGEGEGEGAS